MSVLNGGYQHVAYNTNNSNAYPVSGGILSSDQWSTSLVEQHHHLPYPHQAGVPPYGHVGPVRVVKRRVTANRKERRRTHSINSAFTGLRDCIPNVPSDTKLSKIKTLRLATSYICYLMTILETPGTPLSAFKAELTKKSETKEERRRKEAEEIAKTQSSGGRYNKSMEKSIVDTPPARYETSLTAPAQYQHMLQMQAYQSHQASLQLHQQQQQQQQHSGPKQSNPYGANLSGQSAPVHDPNRGRTGWPQHVWANVLKQERI